jgi:hypothetical protein
MGMGGICEVTMNTIAANTADSASLVGVTYWVFLVVSFRLPIAKWDSIVMAILIKFV